MVITSKTKGKILDFNVIEFFLPFIGPSVDDNILGLPLTVYLEYAAGTQTKKHF